MLVFSSLEAARKEGFLPYDFDRDENLWIVIKERMLQSQRERLLALARPGVGDGHLTDDVSSN